MKKIICKVEYDTEKSQLIAKNTVGAFGETEGYEESLYSHARFVDTFIDKGEQGRLH